MARRGGEERKDCRLRHAMSFKRNVLANYASQIYVTVIGIAIMPLYLGYMGAEAYGLVGFFTTLLAWFYLLDMGLTPTVARETARFRGGATDALSYRRLVRALQAIFLAIAVAGGSAMFASAGFIARDWLSVQALSLNEVQFAVRMIALVVALRWMAGLYRGAISGSEALVWLGGYNAIIATLRFVGVLPVLMFVGPTPTAFFTYQLLVAIVEVAGLAAKTNALLPSVPAGQPLGWSFAPIKAVLKFSLTIAFTSSVWVLVTQTDKLVLSKLLQLAEYGYFMLAVVAASGVLIATLPIPVALMPRMARLEAEGDHAGLIKLYRDATQLVCVIGLPVAFTLAAFAEPVIWAWTGDPVAAKTAAPILQLYALGNAVLAVAGFPYYLQYAKGDLTLHLRGNVLFLILLIPSLVWATLHFGAIGAGWAWLVSILVYFIGWTPLVHRRFEPGLHWRWLLRDVAVSALAAGAIPASLSVITRPPGFRIAVVFFVLLTGLFAAAATALASSTCRAYGMSFIRQSFPRTSVQQ